VRSSGAEQFEEVASKLSYVDGNVLRLLNLTGHCLIVIMLRYISLAGTRHDNAKGCNAYSPDAGLFNRRDQVVRILNLRVLIPGNKLLARPILGKPAVRMGGGWNWLRIVFSGELWYWRC
jgi:hypothetical protein